MKNLKLDQNSLADRSTDISELDAELLSRNYTLTPFTSKEESIEYSTITFNERGVDFTLLKISNQSKPHTGNKYKFGVVDENYNFYWFFNGKSEIRNRSMAVKVFAILKRYCELKDIGEPFAFKST